MPLFNRTEKLLLVIIFLSLVAAGWVAWQRSRVESANREVELIIDGRDLVALADAVGLPPAKVAQRLKNAGAVSLAVNEVSLADLKTRGEAVVQPWGKNTLLYGFTDAALADQVAQALRRKLPGLKLSSPTISRSPFYDELPAYLLLEGELTGVNEAGLFLDPEVVKAAQGAGLRIVARIPNTSLSQRGAITYSLEQVQRAGAELLIFDKEEVLGHDGLIDYAAAEMKRLGLTYGWIELAEQYGEDQMRQQMWDRMIRVHGISERELPKMSLQANLARMLRAARERSIRGCYLRLLLRPQDDLLSYNADDYIKELGNELQRFGLQVGPAQPARPFSAPAWALLLMELGTAAAVTLLAGRLLPLGNRGRLVIFLLPIVLLGGLQFGAHRALLAYQAWGLLAGMSLASLGLLLAFQKMSSEADAPARVEREPLCFSTVFNAVGLLLGVSLLSLTGGLLIAGLLSDSRFMVGAEQFRGVKLLLVMPLFLLAVAMVGNLSQAFTSKRAWRERLATSLRAFAGQPILVGEALVLLLAVGALGILVLRSGNVAAGAAPAAEQHLRQWLEVVLWARPRTKEFMMGHPALLLAGLLWLLNRPVRPGLGVGQQRGLGVLLLVAVIGQASLVDTFCHLHTPISFSLIRACNGLWVGILVGVALVLGWLILKKLLQSEAEPAEVELPSGNPA